MEKNDYLYLALFYRKTQCGGGRKKRKLDICPKQREEGREKKGKEVPFVFPSKKESKSP